MDALSSRGEPLSARALGSQPTGGSREENSGSRCLVDPRRLVFRRSATAAPGGVFPYEIQRHTLDNGLKVLLIPMPSEGLVSYWSVVRTGSRDEVEEGVTGFAHFFEHMMFRGTEKFPADVYDGIVASMGADANAYTSSDITAYHLSFTSEDLPRVIEIESDRFQNLAYAEDVFKTEAGAVYGEYRKNRTNPFCVLIEKLVDTAFDVHTYKHTTMGFEADIKKMPERYDYSKSFFSRFYRPENVVLLVTGDFDPEQTLERIEAAYGGWERGYVAPEVPVEPEQTAPRRVVVPFEGQTLPILAVMFKSDGLDASNGQNGRRAAPGGSALRRDLAALPQAGARRATGAAPLQLLRLRPRPGAVGGDRAWSRTRPTSAPWKPRSGRRSSACRPTG